MSGCFGEAQHDAKACGGDYEQSMREYEARVQQTLKQIGPEAAAKTGLK